MTTVAGDLLLLLVSLLLFSVSLYVINPFLSWETNAKPRVKRVSGALPLRFRAEDGGFKILQVADAHFGNGAATRCRDVAEEEAQYCSDLNTTKFLDRLIQVEKPDLIVFTGDNLFGTSATDAAESLFKVFAPAMESMIPWAAILGNHDHESTLTRQELMSLISLMDYSVAKVNPTNDAGKAAVIDGFGNYDINVHGAWGSGLDNTSILNLYFMDTGAREVIGGRRTYGWIKESQLSWVRSTSQKHQHIFPAPALVFFHIPIPEVRDLWYKKFVGQYQEGVACSTVDSGTLKNFIIMGDVKAAFIGHDHLNDFCGEIDSIYFCYGEVLGITAMAESGGRGEQGLFTSSSGEGRILGRTSKR